MQIVSENKLLNGIFKCELKNRFLCIVEINGYDTICYIPSSSKLGNYIDLNNKQVLLKPIANPNARTKYAVYAIKHKRNYIVLNTSLPNELVFNNISKRRFSFLGYRKQIQKEKSIDDYKCDLYIKDTNTIIEVKSIICTDSEAIFPSVYSERAINQLKKILELLDSNYNVTYIFVSLNPYLKKISINQEDHDYYNLFKTCVAKGMKVYAFTTQTNKDFNIELREQIPVNL